MDGRTSQDTEKSQWARVTYKLESAHRWTSQDMERVQARVMREWNKWTGDSGPWHQRQGLTDRNLSSDLLKPESIRNTEIWLTQIVGNASMHILITFSVFQLPCSMADRALQWDCAHFITLIIHRTYRRTACFMLSSRLSRWTLKSMRATALLESSLAVFSISSLHCWPCLCIPAGQKLA